MSLDLSELDEVLSPFAEEWRRDVRALAVRGLNCSAVLTTKLFNLLDATRAERDEWKAKAEKAEAEARSMVPMRDYEILEAHLSNARAELAATVVNAPNRPAR